MKKYYSLRAMAAAIALVFMLSFAVPALAVDYVEATQGSRVYTYASTSAGSVGTLSRGEVVEKLGVSGSFTKIKFGNSTGYVLTNNTRYSDGSSSLAQSQTPTSTSTSTPAANMYATATANIRSGPGTNYSIIGSLNKNETVVCTGTSGSWYAITWNSGTAYVHTSLLKALTSSSASGSRVMATAPVNVRSGPGTNYSIIGGLNKNETVEKTGTSGTWTKINYSGTTGYVSSAYLTAAITTNTNTTTTTSSNTSNRLYALRTTSIRSGPGSGYSRIGELDAGDYIDYAGSSSGSWYRVEFGSREAYVYSYDVEFYSNYTSSSGTVYAEETTYVYASASSSSNRLGTLYAGDKVSRYGSSNSTWTGIWYNGRQGYVYTSALSYYGSSGFNNSSYIGEYWYATSNKVYCYNSPSTSSSYAGYLTYGEDVWVRYANSTWAEVTISNKTYYVLVNYLSGDGYYYNDNYNYNYYEDTARTRYSTTYVRSSPSLSGYTYTISGKNVTVGIISDNISGYPDYVYIEWYEGGTRYKGYVMDDDLIY